MELLPDIKVSIEQKFGNLEKFLKRFSGKPIELQVEVGKPSQHHHKGEIFYAEANLILPGKEFRAVNNNYDLRVAIDRVREELARQIVKYKEVRIENRK